MSNEEPTPIIDPQAAMDQIRASLPDTMSILWSAYQAALEAGFDADQAFTLTLTLYRETLTQ